MVVQIITHAGRDDYVVQSRNSLYRAAEDLGQSR